MPGNHSGEGAPLPRLHGVDRLTMGRLRNAAQRGVRYLRAAYIDFRLFVTGKRERDLPPLRLRDVGSGDFRSTGTELAQILITRGRLGPHDRVLDIGCGSGRVALPLARHLTPPGSYDGFDIVWRSIAWCRRHVTRRFPHFRFHHVRVRNTAYSFFGKAASQVTFPVADGSIDLAFAFSLFTHLTPDEMRHYLREAHRVLADGGRLVVTFFILNEESLRALDVIDPAYRFPHVEDGVRYASAANRGAGVAIDEARLRDMLRDFREVTIHSGRWAARGEGITFQDLVIARK